LDVEFFIEKNNMSNKIYCFLGLLVMAINAKAQRNTILIIADDLSPDYFGFYENAVDTVDVPHIRSLVANGVRFKYLISNPVCSSTRTTILTGRYSFRTGVGGIVGGTGGSNQIDTAEISIPKLLKLYNPGIAKSNIGKWHLRQPAPPINLTSPLALGYDWSEGPFIGQLPSYTNWQKYTNGVVSNIMNYATSENVDNAVTWLKAQNPSQPFFVWLAFNAPHEPLHLPPAGLHTYTSLSGTPADINAQPKEYFKAMIQAMDHEIGRLFDSLQVMNRYDSTDIIFIGDNGNTPRTAQIADLTKAKGTVYEYGVHVPFIFAGPSVVNKGRVSNALVNTTDLFATIVENFGYTNWQTQIPSNKPADSKSLQSIIKNIGDSVRPWVFSEIFKLTTDSADGKGIRNRNYKLIKFDYGSEEFYNLALDPQESNNLLLGNLSAADIANYYYLCNEMSNLVGGASYCQTGVSVKNEELQNTMVIAPNPAHTQFDLQVNKNTNQHYTFQLVDYIGRTLLERQNLAPQKRYSIDIANFPKGQYLAIINIDGITLTQRIFFD
jgi:arylsulfatase A-like enzyme